MLPIPDAFPSSARFSAFPAAAARARSSERAAVAAVAKEGPAAGGDSGLSSPSRPHKERGVRRGGRRTGERGPGERRRGPRAGPVL